MEDCNFFVNFNPHCDCDLEKLKIKITLLLCTGKQNLNQRRESVFGANVIATAKRNKIKQKVSF